MRDIEDFIRLVQPRAVAAPEPTIIRNVRDAAIEFCERTRLWRETDTIVTTGADAEPISCPSDGIVMAIENCSIDGTKLAPISIADLDRRRPGWRTEDVGSGGGRWYIAPEFGSVQVIPRSSGTILVEFIAKPKPDALTLPDFLFDLYGREIADGAAAGVLLTPGADFSNPNFGALLQAKFTAKLDRFSSAGLKGQQRGPTRVRASFF
ncbi:MAG: hypothetical protein GC182_08890 [Rhodopseudomonas sp.]|nr:hypothetical protein [Rhodopseudomonas sp.]